MVFAIAHFTVGFVIVLVLLSAIPITRYRLTGAYLGGVWALAPDVHHLLDGELSDRIYAVHNDPISDVFFFHYFLDEPQFRAQNDEIAFVSIAVLGVAFLAYDLLFGGRRST